MFMQDNAHCHTVKLVKSFLDQEELSVMDWPAQSLDFNHIENAWKLRERTKKRDPRNVDDLWAILNDEWKKNNTRRMLQFGKL